MPKYVVSQTLDSAPWGTRDDATLVKGGLADAITNLKRQPGKNIGVHGSPTLVEALLYADLLDELRLELYPVIAGRGGRLFEKERAARQLRLTSSRVTRSGVAVLTYQAGNDIDAT